MTISSEPIDVQPFPTEAYTIETLVKQTWGSLSTYADFIVELSQSSQSQLETWCAEMPHNVNTPALFRASDTEFFWAGFGIGPVGSYAEKQGIDEKVWERGSEILVYSLTFSSRYFDTETETFNADFDPNTIAHATLRQVDLNQRAVEINQLAVKLKRSLVSNSRHELITILHQKMSDFLHETGIEADEEFAEGLIPLEILSIVRYHSQYEPDLELNFLFESEELLTALRRSNIETRLDQCPHIDAKEFEKLRKHVGAKGANLLLLRQQINWINETVNNESYKYKIPRFQVIGVGVYEEWKNGGDIDYELHKVWERAKKYGKYIVRSSVVKSEDGDSLTGASIYESEIVPRDATFDEFKTAVVKVYCSVNSNDALEYREQHGIEEESMGLVVQEYIDQIVGVGDERKKIFSKHGFSNSHLDSVPDLMEIQTGHSRNFVRRHDLFPNLASYLADLKTFNIMKDFSFHHFQIDIKVTHPQDVTRVAFVMALIERMWGRPVQVEFAATEKDIYLLQVRPLPITERQTQEIVFPEAEELFVGGAIGIGDYELDVIPAKRSDRSNHKGVVVYESSFNFAKEYGSTTLPARGAGATIVLKNDIASGGHIQTLCTENGTPCVFFDDETFKRRSKEKGKDPIMEKYEAEYKEKIEVLKRAKRLRLVLNGIEGRVYAVDED